MIGIIIIVYFKWFYTNEQMEVFHMNKVLVLILFVLIGMTAGIFAMSSAPKKPCLIEKVVGFVPDTGFRQALASQTEHFPDGDVIAICVYCGEGQVIERKVERRSGAGLFQTFRFRAEWKDRLLSPIGQKLYRKADNFLRENSLEEGKQN